MDANPRPMRIGARASREDTGACCSSTLPRRAARRRGCVPPSAFSASRRMSALLPTYVAQIAAAREVDVAAIARERVSQVAQLGVWAQTVTVPRAWPARYPHEAPGARADRVRPADRELLLISDSVVLDLRVSGSQLPLRRYSTCLRRTDTRSTGGASGGAEGRR
ncbi:hypothetical protein B0H16DRAFT_537255 [Mycena metata]|uniref:Uncharacterized protein n=1 Tax=Mycena metata TaxID=1033252 RepID=A0AAD7NIB8_9AGAR|nr:hypothetical protein B0H16DRAFT_537255 [Mycena metata]